MGGLLNVFVSPVCHLMHHTVNIHLLCQYIHIKCNLHIVLPPD